MLLGKRYRYGGAAARRIGYGNGSLVDFRNFSGNAKSKPLMFTGSVGFIRTVETVKHDLFMTVGDSDTGVPDAQKQGFAVIAAGESDAPLFGIAQGIVQKYDQ